jgi:hypothetical protein
LLLFFKISLIVVEGAQTPLGFSGTGETPVEMAREEGAILPHRSEAPRRLTARPKESEAPGTKISNIFLLQTLTN